MLGSLGGADGGNAQPRKRGILAPQQSSPLFNFDANDNGIDQAIMRFFLQQQGLG
jgi:hypothetical protein